MVRHALFSCTSEVGEQTAGLGQYRNVAVKTLKTKADSTSEQEFLAEIVYVDSRTLFMWGFFNNFDDIFSLFCGGWSGGRHDYSHTLSLCLL